MSRGEQFTISTACDLSLAPLFQEGGVHEGKMISISPANAAAVLNAVEGSNDRQANQTVAYPSSGAMAPSIDSLEEVLVILGGEVEADKYSNPQVNLQETSAIIRIPHIRFLSHFPNDCNKELGYAAQTLLDGIEHREKRASLGASLNKVFKLTGESLGKRFAHLSRATKDMKRLRIIQERGTLRQLWRYNHASYIASLLPDIAEITEN